MLGQRRVDEKSNEITAIPKLLDAPELSGTVVNIDAIGCQRAIVEQIVEKKADYILAIKENQGHLLEEIKDSFVLKFKIELYRIRGSRISRLMNKR